MSKHQDDETARRRDEALKRALNTPPKPHGQMSRKVRGVKTGAFHKRGKRGPKK